MDSTTEKVPLNGQTRQVQQVKSPRKKQLLVDCIEPVSLMCSLKANVYRGQWQFGEMSGKASHQNQLVSLSAVDLRTGNLDDELRICLFWRVPRWKHGGKGLCWCN